MTRYIKYLILMTLILCSCDKLQINGKLDGMWQVMSVEKESKIQECPPYQCYWCVQLHMIQFTNTNMDKTYISTFQNKDGKLYLKQISFPSRHEKESDDDKEMSQDDIKERLHPWGIWTVNDCFDIVCLNNERLVLRSDSVTVTLRKF